MAWQELGIFPWFRQQPKGEASIGKMAYYKFCFGKQSSVQTIVKGGEGEAALKAAAAPLPEQPQLPACSWSPGAETGDRGLGLTFRNLTKRRRSPSAPGPPGVCGASLQKRSWRKGVRSIWERSSTQSSLLEPLWSLRLTLGVRNLKENESLGMQKAGQVSSWPPACFRVPASHFT